MSQDEVKAIVEAKHTDDTVSWEQTRTIAFYNVVSQVGTKNIKSPQDLFKFNWDDPKGSTSHKEVGDRLNKNEFLKRANILINGK